MSTENRRPVVVITGAGSGIGAATADYLGRSGWDVAAADLDVDAAERTADVVRGGGGRATAVRADVTDAASLEAAVALIVHEFGRIDALVACAGIPERKGPIHEMDPADWSRVIDVDLTGVALTNRAVLGHLLERGGAVVNIASILGEVGAANSQAYTAAKHGVVGLTKALAVTYAKAGIRVNAVAPAYVDTPLLRRLPAEVQATMVDRTPIGRLADPLEVASVVGFLLSSQASYVTGACVPVDGGYLAV